MLKEANKIFYVSFEENPFVYTSIRYRTIKLIFPRDIGGFSQIGASKTD